MFIVLDTNILFSSPRFNKNPNFRVLFDYIDHREEDTLAIPQLVFDELSNKCREAIEEIHQDLKKLLRDFEKWTGKNLKDPLTDKKVSNEIVAYTQYVEETFRYRATILGYPSISHDMLVAKALARRKPFSTDGREGYRDALIWQSIIDFLIKTDENIVFITNNKQDFFDKEGNLHPDLIDDLQKLDIDVARISCFPNLQKFIDTHVKPYLEAIEKIGNHIIQDVKEEIIQELLSSEYKGSLDAENVGLPAEVEHVTLSFVYDISDLHATNTYKLSDEEWLIEAEAIADCEFNFLVFDLDWLYIQKHSHLGGQILDDSGDDFIWASATTTVKFTFSLTYDKKTGSISSFEVSSINSV